MSSVEQNRIALAERLRLAREMAGLSQGQVAKLLGLHRPSISEMEAGRRKVASEELVELASTYGVTIEWLLGADTPESDARRAKLALAARELSKLKEEDLDRLFQILSTLRLQQDET